MELGFIYIIHAVFFLVLDIFIYRRCFSMRKQSPSQHTFSYFALAVILLQVTAIVTIAIENGLVKNTGALNAVIYFLLITLPAVAAYSAVTWLVRLFGLFKGKWSMPLRIIGAIPVLLYAVINLISFKTHWTFYLDENWSYHRGDLFFLQFVFPYAYVVGFIVFLIIEKLRHSNIQNDKALKIIALYMTPPLFGSMMQVLFSMKGACFSELGVSASLILTFIGMYMGDAEENRRLKDLADFNEKLQFANKQMRTVLMRGELQAKTVAESIHGGFKISLDDKLFSLKYVSDQFAKMLGYTVNELMEVSGGTMAGLVDVESARSEIKKARHKVDAGEMYVMNFRMRCKDGSWKHVEEHGRLIKTGNTDGEFWSVIVDKNEQVRTEEALASVKKSRKKLAEYNDIISTAGMGIWFVTLKEDGKNTLHGNDKFYELIGIDASNMSREEIHDYVKNRILPEDLPAFNNAIEKMKEGQFAEALYRWVHPTKGIIYNRCGGIGHKHADGTYALSGYHSDATSIVENERKQQELLKNALAAAEESNRAKTAFLNNMSHDIRTPMNAILGFTTLMEKECDNPEKIQDYLKKIKGAGDFLLSLINNVLEMARIESGKTEINELPTKLSNNTKRTMDLFETSLKEKKLTISSSMDIQHNFVYADMVKVREILINLISNAIKYSNPGGHIETSMTEVPCPHEGYAAYNFIVKDAGIGISDEFLPHIFESFAREKNSTESKIAGTGLGLPIVKKLVDLMGGKITVESILGQGTAFTVYLEHRICTEKDVISSMDAAAYVKKDFIGSQILLVEDNDLNAEIAETLLTDKGFIVERAIDGVVCLDMLQKAGPYYYDAILMDIQMPNMNGYEATKRIRQLDNEALRNIPIVAMTANAFDEDKRAAIQAGMNAHVAKPIDMDLLLKTLTNILK